MAVIAMVWVTFKNLVAAFIRMMDEVASLQAGDFHVNSAKAIQLAFQESVSVLMPILGIAMPVAFAANYFQVGSIFAFQ
eukprot:gene20124-20671_t